MDSLRHPFSVSGLSALALIAGLAQAPAKAQANALQELSRQMIGSSFDNNVSPTTLPGSPSLVEGGSQSSGRVVTDLVDDEIRRRPAAAKPAPAKAGLKTVQLLVPVRTGLEFAQIEKLVPGVKILEMNGGVFVLVSEMPQALPAYQKGRDLQAKLGVDFQLAYSDGHPDLNLAWMAAVNTDLASAPRPLSTEKTVAVKPQATPKPGMANDLGLFVAKAPWLSPAETATQQTSQPLPPVGATQPAPIANAAKPEEKSDPAVSAKAGSNLRGTLAEHPAMSQATAPVAVATPVSLPNQPKSSVAQAVEPKPEAIPEPVFSAKGVSNLQDTLAELRAMRQVTAPLAEAPSISLPGRPGPAVAQAVPKPSLTPLVQPVSIHASGLGDVPLVNTRFMAVNQDLAYVYVKVRNGAELADVNRVAPVAVVHDRDGQLLARVGVYTNTRVGQRLRDQQLKQLQQRGYDVELIAGSGIYTASNQA
jgi:hypothetical protein